MYCMQIYNTSVDTDATIFSFVYYCKYDYEKLTKKGKKENVDFSYTKSYIALAYK